MNDKTKEIAFGPRRAYHTEISDERWLPLSAEEEVRFEGLDRYYRALCTMLYNYAPLSGHPGGSISSGRIASAILFDSAAYDLSHPHRRDADIVSYAAGHKALGLYSLWALRNELARIAAPELLPHSEVDQLRFEDLLGFRRNPTNQTPLFRAFHSKALDGHPTPATPFVRLTTGASGVGLGASLGLALAAADSYPDDPPFVHIIEGEGGLTPGRVSEALAFAATAGLSNAIVHVDWNQSSIDSDRVTREGRNSGDYVQWDPSELFYLHDWNVISVPDGTSFQYVIGAQRLAMQRRNSQPTAIIYRTTKGWQYGMEGRASHGAGHKLCSAGFYAALTPLLEDGVAGLPQCEGAAGCANGTDRQALEQCFWIALEKVRKTLGSDSDTTKFFASRLREARVKLVTARRKTQHDPKRLAQVFNVDRDATPDALRLAPGTSTTLRGQLGKVLSSFNEVSGGAFFTAAADLLGSTSIDEVGKSFGRGFFNLHANRESRILSVGGICEDAMAAVLSGVSAFGAHIGVGASYGAFMAPLGHIAARLHAIGAQARKVTFGDDYTPMILVCAHAGLKTGEDGPTHADPQALQLLGENFPAGTSITLTPWDPQEIFPLFTKAMQARPAIIAPFVTRPSEPVVDRTLMGLAPADAASTGVYKLRAARGRADATLVLQESGVTYEFILEALPKLLSAGVDVDVYYVASAELFDLLSPAEQAAIFPEEKGMEAMGITGFTLATMHRWIRSDAGRTHTLHPFMRGHFLGSGPAREVLLEAGLDGASQFEAIIRFIESRERARVGQGVRAQSVRAI